MSGNLRPKWLPSYLVERTENLEYLRALERQGLAEVGTAVRYGTFGQLAVMARLAPALIARG